MSHFLKEIEKGLSYFRAAHGFHMYVPCANFMANRIRPLSPANRCEL